MGDSLLVQFFSALHDDALLGSLDAPARRHLEDQETVGDVPEQRSGGKARRRAAVHLFAKNLNEKYTEGTLLRILDRGDLIDRRAAVFALGLIGTMEANEPLAAALHEPDEQVAFLASEALWTLWFRGENARRGEELYQAVRHRDAGNAIDALDALIDRAPSFAEALNQRAILLYRAERYEEAAADCAGAVEVNGCHFGARAGLGSCLLRMGRPGDALDAFRGALRVNPRLDGCADAVQSLAETLSDRGEG